MATENQDVSAQESKRIISHMNNDHAESLSHYLEYYGRISPRLASRDPKFTTFETSAMQIEYGKPGNRKTWTYKFQPPMYAGQARKRLEAMHQECRTGLGLSEARVNEFNLDFATYLNLALVLAIQVFVFRLPAATLLRYAGWVREPLTRVLLALNVVPTPERIAVAAKVALATLWYTAHFVEAVVKTRSLLHRFNTTSPVVRSLYYIATLIGGFPVFMRLRTVGERLERHLEAKKAKEH